MTSTCASSTPSGYYCGAQGLSNVTGPCLPGYYCPQGQSSSQPTNHTCPTAHFCLLASDLPSACPSGTYQVNIRPLPVSPSSSLPPPLSPPSISLTPSLYLFPLYIPPFIILYPSLHLSPLLHPSISLTSLHPFISIPLDPSIFLTPPFLSPSPLIPYHPSTPLTLSPLRSRTAVNPCASPACKGSTATPPARRSPTTRRPSVPRATTAPTVPGTPPSTLVLWEPTTTRLA